MVKCAECGYLAQHVYRGSIPEGFIDVEENSRETGSLPTVPFSLRFTPIGQPDLTPEKMSGDNFPTCFSRAFQLGNETVTRYAEIYAAEKGTMANAVKEVIHKDRACNQFVKWERGFTPKEHREMIDREYLQKHQDERDNADKLFRQQMANDERIWRETQEAKHSNEEWMRNLLIGGFTVFGAIAGGIVGHFIR